MSNTYKVHQAFYGAVNSTTKQSQFADVSSQLQTLLNSSSVVKITNSLAFADPCPGVVKGFYAIVSINSTPYTFTGSEGSTIDFSLTPLLQ